ncbi:hypothetical protein ACFLZ7_03815 [Nanoarchaeota archaeon]
MSATKTIKHIGKMLYAIPTQGIKDIYSSTKGKVSSAVEFIEEEGEKAKRFSEEKKARKEAEAELRKAERAKIKSFSEVRKENGLWEAIKDDYRKSNFTRVTAPVSYPAIATLALADSLLQIPRGIKGGIEASEKGYDSLSDMLEKEKITDDDFDKRMDFLTEDPVKSMIELPFKLAYGMATPIKETVKKDERRDAIKNLAHTIHKVAEKRREPVKGNKFIEYLKGFKDGERDGNPEEDYLFRWSDVGKAIVNPFKQTRKHLKELKRIRKKVSKKKGLWKGLKNAGLNDYHKSSQGAQDVVDSIVYLVRDAPKDIKNLVIDYLKSMDEGFKNVAEYGIPLIKMLPGMAVELKDLAKNKTNNAVWRPFVKYCATDRDLELLTDNKGTVHSDFDLIDRKRIFTGEKPIVRPGKELYEKGRKGSGMDAAILDKDSEALEHMLTQEVNNGDYDFSKSIEDVHRPLTEKELLRLYVKNRKSENIPHDLVDRIIGQSIYTDNERLRDYVVKNTDRDLADSIVKHTLAKNPDQSTEMKEEAINTINIAVLNAMERQGYEITHEDDFRVLRNALNTMYVAPEFDDGNSLTGSLYKRLLWNDGTDKVFFNGLFGDEDKVMLKDNLRQIIVSSKDLEECDQRIEEHYKGTVENVVAGVVNYELEHGETMDPSVYASTNGLITELGETEKFKSEMDRLVSRGTANDIKAVEAYNRILGPDCEAENFKSEMEKTALLRRTNELDAYKRILGIDDGTESRN